MDGSVRHSVVAEAPATTPTVQVQGAVCFSIKGYGNGEEEGGVGIVELSSRYYTPRMLPRPVPGFPLWGEQEKRPHTQGTQASSVCRINPFSSEIVVVYSLLVSAAHIV